MKAEKIFEKAVGAESKKSTTMLEINDSNREHEYRRRRSYIGSYDSQYVKPFVSFLESLGYKIEQGYESDPTIMIDGFRFRINTDNASYKSQNAFTRQIEVRKPENRFIVLEGFSKIRIHFNKEYDIAKLKAKIDANINKYHEREKSNEEYAAKQEQNATAIAMNYLSNEKIKEAVNYVMLDRGELTFRFHDKDFSLTIGLGEPAKIRANVNFGDINSYEGIAILADNIQERTNKFGNVVAEILKMPKLSAELVEWSKSLYYGYFYTETMSTKL